MYHFTDFETSFECENEVCIADIGVPDQQQQQCLPVDDTDDLSYSILTIEGRRYLKQVRSEATNYQVMRSVKNIPIKPFNLEMLASAANSSANMNANTNIALKSDVIWISPKFIAQILQKFKYTRKLIELHRNQICESRSDLETHFDIARAVRTRQWWLEYCFGSARFMPNDNNRLWSAGDNGDPSANRHANDNTPDGTWQDEDEEEEEEEDDDEEEDYVDDEEYLQDQNGKLDFNFEKIKLGECILWTVNICENRGSHLDSSEPSNNAYATGHIPQISFLSEIDQTEVIRVLRFCQIWLRRDGYRPQLGLWLYGLLALLDLIQTRDVFHQLRQLFVDCNRIRIQTLMEASSLKSELSKVNAKLVPSACRNIDSSSNSDTNPKCIVCDKIQNLRKQNSALCLILLIIVHFFGQKDLIDTLKQQQIAAASNLKP